jgi:peptidyl-tRNA hydrolase, PTH1 family
MKYLIAGLGNIGPDYAQTRHNIGFMVADRLAEKHDAVFAPARYGDMASFRHKGRTFVLIKPSTYMNLSGRPVYYWMNKENISLENILVVVDDLALPLGVLRLRARGGAGGHNGLISIIDVLGTDQFSRLRFGIGDDYPKGFQSQYVLGKWEAAELEVVNPRVDMAADMALSFGMQGIERTMNLYNKKP